jgi:hypothetical protein
MADFLKDCYFNSFCKGRKNFVPTPRYAKKIRAMPHSAESRLSAMQHSAESIFVYKKKFYLRLRAMQLNVKFKSKIFLSTPPYAAQRGADSALCFIAGSRDSVLCGIAQSCSANFNLYAKPF